MRYRLLETSGLPVSELFLGAVTLAEGFAHGAGVDDARRIVDASWVNGQCSIATEVWRPLSSGRS